MTEVDRHERLTAELGYPWLAELLRRATRLQFTEAQVVRIVALADRKLSDLLEIGERHALANGRAVVMLHDLPLTKGLQTTLQTFKQLEREADAAPLQLFLHRVVAPPALDLDVRASLPHLAGALVVLAGQVIATVVVVVVDSAGIGGAGRPGWPGHRHPRARPVVTGGASEPPAPNGRQPADRMGAGAGDSNSRPGAVTPRRLRQVRVRTWQVSVGEEAS